MWYWHNSRPQVLLQSCNHQDSVVLAQKKKKNRQIDQWNRIENLEMDPQLYGQLIFDVAERISTGKNDSFINTGCWEIEQPHKEE